MKQRARFRTIPFSVWTRLLAVIVLLCGIMASSSAQTTIPLSWIRDDNASWNQVDKREPVFLKEPAYAGDAVTRGMIVLGSGAAERVGFAFDERGKRVYVDINRDLDLGNDPKGVVTTAGDRASLDVPLTTATLSPSVHVEFWKPNSRQPLLTKVCGSLCGEFELDGRKWYARLAESGLISVSGSTGTNHSLCASISTRRQECILNGRSVSLKVIPDSETSSVRMLSLAVRETSMGTLLLPGKDVECISMSFTTGTKARDFSTLLVDGPTSAIDLPAGDYQLLNVRLADGRMASSPSDMKRFTIRPDITTTLAVGGPIRGDATAIPCASRLLLDYSATGIGGESYGARTSSVPIRFAIYKGTRRIATGKFEYG